MPPPPPNVSVLDLIDRYSAILFDSIGVLVHAAGAIPGAAEVIARLNEIKKPFYVLTNDASALPARRAQKYQSLGLAIEERQIITSGYLLKDYFRTRGITGAPCAVLGTADTVSYVKAAGGRVVSPTEPFDVIVLGNSSGFPFLEGIEAVLTGLLQKLDAGGTVRLILPNPDLIYVAGQGKFGIASGSVAVMLEEILGRRYADQVNLRFVRLGKPGPAMFQEGVRRCGTKDVVMIGDQLETDIAGANEFGIDSVLVGTGVHTANGSATAPRHVTPNFYMASLALNGSVASVTERNNPKNAARG